MKIVWSADAVDDLAALRTYIEREEPQAARRIALHILDSIESLLPESSQMGRAGRVPGTRELVIPKTPFIVPYRIRGGVIEILRVYHASRRWPESF